GYQGILDVNLGELELGLDRIDDLAADIQGEADRLLLVVIVGERYRGITVADRDASSILDLFERAAQLLCSERRRRKCDRGERQAQWFQVFPHCLLLLAHRAIAWSMMQRTRSGTGHREVWTQVSHVMIHCITSFLGQGQEYDDALNKSQVSMASQSHSYFSCRFRHLRRASNSMRLRRSRECYETGRPFAILAEPRQGKRLSRHCSSIGRVSKTGETASTVDRI